MCRLSKVVGFNSVLWKGERMSTIIGCGTVDTGGFNKCIDCPFQDDPESCLVFMRASGSKTKEREIMEPKIKLAFKKYRLLKSNVYQVPEQKFIPAYLSKKLYDRCIKTCHPDTIQAHRERMNSILSMKYELSWATYIKFGKYTVVEIFYQGKHFHGLAALNPGDHESISAGIAYAYHRAFDNMMEDTR